MILFVWLISLIFSHLLWSVCISFFYRDALFLFFLVCIFFSYSSHHHLLKNVLLWCFLIFLIYDHYHHHRHRLLWTKVQFTINVLVLFPSLKGPFGTVLNVSSSIVFLLQTDLFKTLLNFLSNYIIVFLTNFPTINFCFIRKESH